MLSSPKILVNGCAVLLLLAACFLTVLAQLNKSQSHSSHYPNAELEIESLNQVEEINADRFKTYEIAPSQND